MRVNGRYQRNALKTLARDFSDQANEDSIEFDAQATSYWDQAIGLWKAVDKGNRDGVPAYNGGMFSSDAIVSPVGGRIAELSLSNAEFGPALQALLVDFTPDGVFGPVDFRSLSVREFGTIYEGCWSRPVEAPSDLASTEKAPTFPREDAGLESPSPKAMIYFHNQSGARKATGATSPSRSQSSTCSTTPLEPALDDHLAAPVDVLEAGDEAGAAYAFFDFRVADIAMGSGHPSSSPRRPCRSPTLLFLVGPSRSQGCSQNSEIASSGVRRSRASSRLAAGVAWSTVTDATAGCPACIYGVDINPVAAELARLAIWIHTFVAGLPLRFLDHTLIQGTV